MTEIRDSLEGHQCFGCQKQIADGESHIHIGLDEWAAREGLPGFGLDDLLTLALCVSCTEPAKDGWRPEAHRVSGLPAYTPRQERQS